ncbi:MAG: zinc-ribbon and DUF3426 domain-containing protein [bacterium]
MSIASRTACPSCRAMYALRESARRARDGLVRCGRCNEVFHAEANLIAQRESAADDSVAVTFAATDDSTADDFATTDDFATDDSTTDNSAADDLATDDSATPRTASANARAALAEWSGYLRWTAAALGCLLLLGWQVEHSVLPKRAQDEGYRRHLATFCRIAGCALPPRSDAARLALTHTIAELHPRTPGAVRVTVKLVNHAEFAQPYPPLRLTLTDRDGRVVGRRVFQPSAYLRPGQRDSLDAGELGTAWFDLARPYRQAVGFEVDLVADHL